MSYARYAQKATTFAATLFKHTLYALKVGQQVALRVYEKEKMSPPSTNELSQSVTALQSVFKAAFKMAKSKQLPNAEQLKSTGRVGLELVGFFTIGEIIGRRNLIGYKIKN